MLNNKNKYDSRNLKHLNMHIAVQVYIMYKYNVKLLIRYNKIYYNKIKYF